MVTRTAVMVVMVGMLWSLSGCVSVKAPERIDIGGGSSRPEPVDSARVPNPSTMDEARHELRKAYANIQWLEDEVAGLEKDKAKYKRERDKYKKQRDDCEDRLEKYEED